MLISIKISRHSVFCFFFCFFVFFFFFVFCFCLFFFFFGGGGGGGSDKPRMLFFTLINCWHFNIYEQEKFHAQLN